MEKIGASRASREVLRLKLEEWTSHNWVSILQIDSSQLSISIPSKVIIVPFSESEEVPPCPPENRNQAVKQKWPAEVTMNIP